MLMSLDLFGSCKPGLSIRPHLSHEQDKLHARNSYNDNKNCQGEKQEGDTKYVEGDARTGCRRNILLRAGSATSGSPSVTPCTSFLPATFNLYPDQTFLAIFFVAEFPQKICVLIQNLLASFQLVSSQHRATHSDMSFQAK